MEKEKNSDTFCPIPWIFEAVKANGDIRVCCHADEHKGKGVVYDSQGRAYNAGRNELSESRNADKMRRIRRNMLNGVWSDECGRCKKEEENGLVSRRSWETETWDFTIEKAREATQVDGTIDINETPVVYWDLRFGNFCNLRCRMCGPHDSSAWYDDWAKLGKEFNANPEDFEWANNEHFWTQLEENIPNMEWVYLAGGEPLLIERHYDFLDKCIASNYAKQITLEYNTNLTFLPERVIEAWKHFKKVKVGASIDGYGEVFEYIRYPAKWTKVYNNMMILDKLPPNIRSQLAFTVTAENVHHMPDFMKWKLSESGFERVNSPTIRTTRPILSYHMAHKPKYLNVRVLPEKYKLNVTKKFEQFVNWTKENHQPENIIKQATEIAYGVCNYMNNESYYDDSWNEFKDFSSKLDKIRGHVKKGIL